MTEKVHAIVILLRRLCVFLSLAALVTVFVYSPFYARSALWLLDYFITPQIDPIAAQSQKNGQLSTENHFEPGSPEWLARRAYLDAVNQALEQGNGQKFLHLQQRYQLLMQLLAEQKLSKKELDLNTTPHQIILYPDKNHQEDAIELSDTLTSIHRDHTAHNASLLQRYQAFLTQDAQLIQLEPLTPNATPLVQPEQNFFLQRSLHQPHAIVILGGGLTTGSKKDEIVVNAYTQKRLEQAVQIYQQQHLPIVLSGVEAPYMQKWLEQHGIQAQFLENSSMNTCENTRFSALLLQKQGGAPTVFLITDAYHMPRSQRLFAINGIATQPVISPLPHPLTQWQPSSQNLMHSRRATYEILATLRDVWFGESNCREIP